MKIILRADVRDLGRTGDMVEVKDGYARNFLLPKTLAVVATPANVRDYQKKIAAAKEREAREKAAAQALAGQIKSLKVMLTHRVAEGSTRLHGSVTSQEIADALRDLLAGHPIDRRDIEIRQPIRTLGEHTVVVKLARGVSTPVNVVVSDPEAPVEEPSQD